MQKFGRARTRFMGGAHTNVANVANVANVTDVAEATATKTSTRARGMVNTLWRRLRAFVTQEPVAQAAGIWLATRIGYIILTYYIGAMLVSYLGNSPRGTFLLSWNEFDANWYIRISQLGYYGVEPTAFFPLYPMLITALTWVLGDANRVLAAMIVGNLGTLLAFVAVALLAVHEYGKDTASKAVRMLAAFPVAYFFFAPYTEGLFTGLAALTFLNARKGNWYWTAFWGLLAGLARPTGVILVPALFWEFGRQHGWWKRDFWRAGNWKQVLNVPLLTRLVAAVAAAPFALVLFMLYTWITIGHPLATFNSHHEFWNRHSAPIWETLWQVLVHGFTAPFASLTQSWILLDLYAVFFVAIITLVAIRKLPFAYTIYIAALLYLSLYSPIPYSTSQPVMIYAAARFMLPAIPVFLLLGKWVAKRPSLEMFFLSTGFLLQTVFIIMVTTGIHLLIE